MAVERRERILAMINSRGLVSLKELEHTFPEVSSMTLRRDLQYLDDRGEVIRVRRGARAVRAQISGELEPVYTMRAVESQDAKDTVASAALPLIETGLTMYIDAGTTCMRLVRKMPDVKYSVVTHALNIALEVSKYQFPNVFVLGGRVLKGSLANVGFPTLSMLEQFNLDLAFICTAGYVAGGGFTLGNPEEGELKRSILRKARRKVLLMDQSKVGRSFALTFAKLSDFDMIITDGPIRSDAAQQMVDEATELGIEVIIAEKEKKA